MRGGGHVAHLAFRGAWFPGGLERRTLGSPFQEETRMCGFVGGTLRTILDDKRLDGALESLHHRGPDSRGKWVSDDGPTI
jgi:hypothetical protein